MDIKEFTRKNADALKKTIGEKLTCPMCGHKGQSLRWTIEAVLFWEI